MTLLNRLAGRKESEAVKAANFILSASWEEAKKVLPNLAQLDCREDAILVFRGHFCKGGDNFRVFQGLAAVQSLAAIEPLLKMFRSLKPYRFLADGSVAKGGEGENGGAASAIAQIPDGLKKARELCADEEFEDLVLTAWAYSRGPDAVIMAFGELGSLMAIARLMDQVLWRADLRMRGSRAGFREGAAAPHPTVEKDALIAVGSKANAHLLEALRWPCSDPDTQLMFRQEILYVLKATGDKRCIPAITELINRDSQIDREAKEALEAIAAGRAGKGVGSGNRRR